MARALFQHETRRPVRQPAIQAIQKIAAIAGAAAPLIFWLIFISAGLLRPGYNPIRQYGSELEAGMHGWLQRGNFIVVGLLMVALAYSLHRGIAKGPGWLIGPALIAIAGLALASEGLFPSGTIHYRAFKVFSYGLIAAFAILALRLRADPRWRALAPYSVLAAILALVLWIAYARGNLGVSLMEWIGLVQRLYLAVIFVWLEVLAVRHLTLLWRADAFATSGR